jgi:hypothetical protein
MNDEYVTHFKVLSQHLLEGDENQKTQNAAKIQTWLNTSLDHQSPPLQLPAQFL